MFPLMRLTVYEGCINKIEQSVYLVGMFCYSGHARPYTYTAPKMDS